jgi:putative inorganic carbon (hco3(-)) transporter
LPARAVWRPPWYAWTLLGASALVALYLRAPQAVRGDAAPAVYIGAVALLLAAIAVWELPPAVMLCVAIVLTVFSGNWGELGLHGLPLDRVAMAGVVLALLLRAPGAARVPRLRVTGVHLLMAFVVLYVIASAAASGTIFTESGFLKLFDNLGVMPYLMFLLAPVVFAGARERSLLLGTLVGLGAYLGLTSIFESIGPHSLVFPHYIAEAGNASGAEQAAGPFKATITQGFACFACAVAAAIAFYVWRSRSWRLVAAFVGVVCLIGCFLTLERGVWIAAGLGVAAAMLAAPGLRRWLIPATVAVALVVTVVLLASPTVSEHASARVEDRLSVWDRQNQTATALRMIDARPLFGVGWDRYTSESLDYFRQPPDYPMTGFSDRNVPLPLHDSYLSFAVEIGLVGALLWIVALVWGVGGAILRPASRALAPWRIGLIAIAVFFCVLAAFDPLQQPFTMILLWVWAGTVLARDVEAEGVERAERAGGLTRTLAVPARS